MNRFRELEYRKEIPIYEKNAPKPAGSHLIKVKTERLYKYYKCDYCGNEIIIKDKRYEMTGGIVELPHTLTHRGDIKLAVCNKCLKPLVKEIEKEM